MKDIEIRVHLQELSKEHKKEETELEDAEIIERDALKAIARFIREHQLDQEITKIEGLISDVGTMSSDQLRYLVDSVSLSHEIVFDLNWTFESSFWPDAFESKEAYRVIIREMIENKDEFYNLEDEF